MKESLNELAQQIDAASDQNDIETLSQGIVRCKEMLNSAQGTDRPLIYYFQANAYRGLWQVKARDETYVFNWIQPERTGEILALRQARRDQCFDHLHPIRRCQILTNLGNALNAVGRPIEALEEWNSALEIIPRFAMTLGSRGEGLLSYNRALYDRGHRNVFLTEALRNFREALSRQATWESEYPNPREVFQTYVNKIETRLDPHFDENHFKSTDWPSGLSRNEKKFKKWRLGKKLFLNPLNDLGTWPIVAHDIFHLPSHTYEIDGAPRFVQFYDLLKQEYVTACLLLFEGIQNTQNHHADKGNLVFEYFDGSIGGVNIEKQKMAFRSAYSILDKIAVFLNEYYGLQKNQRRLNFRTVWYHEKDINSRIPQENWRLRGLYALSLDLFDSEFQETALPHSELLNNVRNAAEHRFLRVFKNETDILSDNTTTTVTYSELHNLALTMLKISRSALIHLSLSMHHQENTMSFGRGT